MLPISLRELISSVTRRDPPPQHVGEFVSLCRKIALVQLRRKVASGRLNIDYFRMSLDDIAIDAIADLLHEDDDGSLVQVSAYFAGLSYESLSEEHLLAHLRRLIFGKVNQAMFRMYNELDPSLGRILRNMKLAFQSLQNFVVVDRFGEQWAAPAACDRLEHLPPICRESLEREIRDYFRADERIPRILAKLGHCLRDQSEHSRMVPLMTVAFALRAVFSGDQPPDQAEEIAEARLFVEDASAIIAQTCRSLARVYAPQYVGKKEVPKEVFTKYFEVIERNLLERLIGQDGELTSFYESLRSVMPELTPTEYAETHRSRVEYLARLSYDAAVAELRKHA